MLKPIKSFVTSESGAVTIDWVVLTAGIVVLAMIVVQMIKPSTFGLASRINSAVETVEVEP